MTHDLDFGAMIAAGGLDGPSVLPIRTQNVLPDAIGGRVMQALAAFAVELGQGALVTITSELGRAARSTVPAEIGLRMPVPGGNFPQAPADHP